MRQLLASIFSVSIALCLAGCSGGDSQSAAAPEPAKAATAAAQSAPQDTTEQMGGGDPTVVDPDRYTVEFENDAVRILRIKYGPGEESVMHTHPSSVAVFLTDAEGVMALPDGSSVEVSVSAGSASYSAGSVHQPKNTSDSAWEVVEIELKSRASGQGEPDGPDSTVVDADHYTTEFENDAVRIVRIKYGAGEESVMHYHPDSVAVFLTDQLVRMTLPDGTAEEYPAAAGDVGFTPAGQHLPKNISDSDLELVLVELK